jgi:hypothetical protein
MTMTNITTTMTQMFNTRKPFGVDEHRLVMLGYCFFKQSKLSVDKLLSVENCCILMCNDNAALDINVDTSSIKINHEPICV